jgi:hypothetical protein
MRWLVETFVGGRLGFLLYSAAALTTLVGFVFLVVEREWLWSLVCLIATTWAIANAAQDLKRRHM